MRSLLIFFCLLPVLIVAQSWEIWNMANAGLPSNTIKALAQDHDGIVWAATDWGLCHFENDQWTVIQQQVGGLPENGLTSLAVDSANRLWVGTALHGVAIHDNGNWSH